MTRRWVLACTVAETFGMAVSAGSARAAGELGTLAGLLLVLAGGLAEGTALGLLQGSVLRDRLGGRRTGWVLATVLVAGLGWAAGSAPAALSGDDTGGGPALALVLLGAAAIGLLMGAVLGAVQATVLRHHVRHPWRWSTANACGWAVAMPVVFLGATTAGAGWPWPVVVGYGAATGAVAGAALGAVTGAWLPSLDGLPVRHRTVLAYLTWRRPAARAGWTVLTVTGRRTGRQFSFPVMAAPLGNASLVVLPGHHKGKSWWRNLAPGMEVRVLDRGTWLLAWGRLLTPGSLDFSVARSAYVARWPRASFGAGPLVVLDLRPASHHDQGDQSPTSEGPGAVGAMFPNT
jgi:hypothetical protein